MLVVRKVSVKGQEIECGQINVIIGSNNSGKSTFLRELASVSNLAIPEDSRWLNSVTIEISGLRSGLQEMMPNLFKATTFKEIQDYRNLRARFFSPQTANGSNYHGQDFYQRALEATDTPIELEITNNQLLSQSTPVTIRFAIMKSLAVELCEQRIQTSPGYDTQINDINDAPGDVVGFFWRYPDAFARVQASMKHAFGIDIGFDNLVQAAHPVRILPRQKITGDNRLPETAEEWSKKSPLLKDQGDGIKAYYKILISIEDKTNRVIIVDEPESFLHPPQRRDLGRAVVDLAVEDHKQLFISTHDSEFLRGVLDMGVDLKIFYINNDSENHSIEIITSDDIRSLTAQTGATLKSNLLNERVLNSFFYKKTVVCESENDRTFYEQASALYHWQLFQDVNFIGFTGKEFARPLFERLRSLHINAALLVDIDYLLDGQLPQAMEQAKKDKFNDLRQAIRAHIAPQGCTPAQAKEGRNRFKKYGYKMLSTNPALLSRFWVVISLLKDEGIHVVPIGEMESFTGSTKNDLDHSLGIIRQTKKRALSNFLKEVLAH